MKTAFLLFLFFISSHIFFSQSYNLAVVNGYGSGQYFAGDTVDIWSVAFYDKTFFNRWTGDTTLLNDPLDWHTRLVMPDHDVTLEALLGELPDEALYLTTQVQAVDTIKKLWLGFPGMPPKGIVWLFHGTNGSGENFFLNNDMFLCVKRMIAEGFAVLALDCEEKTYFEDFNGDGAYRWDYTVDSLQNIDLRNIKAIRDSMINRGWIDANTIHIGFGYSAGGAFATHIATQLRWRAGIGHNTAGVPWVPVVGQTPILYSMTEHDDHPEVGAEAAMRAEEYAATLQSRGICSAYRYAHDQPLYPERFNRDAFINLGRSVDIFDELKSNNILDDQNYMLLKGEEVLNLIGLTPLQWPIFLSLTPAQQSFVLEEIDETYATHRFNSDLFGSDLRFMLSLCEQTSSVTQTGYEHLIVYPNPAGDYLHVPNEGKSYQVYDTSGKRMLNSNSKWLDIALWPEGMYIIICGHKMGRFVKM